MRRCNARRQLGSTRGWGAASPSMGGIAAFERQVAQRAGWVARPSWRD
jgi:hypothetical protein